MAFTFPVSQPWPFNQALPFVAGVNGLIDSGSAGASAEAVAWIGHIHIDGRPTSGKKLDATGSSSIGWSSGTNAFADAASEMRIGIQAVDTSGPIARPTGTFLTHAAITTGNQTSPVLASDDQWIVAVPTTGSASIDDGDLIAVVAQFYNRAGTDSLNFSTISPGLGSGTGMFPTTNSFVGSGPAWQTSTTLGAGNIPDCVITFNDGTLATFYGAPFVGTPNARTWNNTATPDERGNLFSVPFNCKVDGAWCAMRTADASSDFQIALIENAESGRTTLASVTVDAAQLGPTAAEGPVRVKFSPEVALSSSVDYCIAVIPTTNNNIRFNELILGSADHRRFLGPGGSTVRGVVATNGGDFSASSTTVIYPIGVYISQNTDTGAAPASGGGLKLVGGGGLVG